MRERYDLGWSADIRNREAMESDLRMVAGDQWPEDVRLEREGATQPRPCITENLLPQFVRQVGNDMRANPPAVKVIAGSGGASKPVADILTGMVRNIEARSATLRPYVTAGVSATTRQTIRRRCRSGRQASPIDMLVLSQLLLHV